MTDATPLTVRLDPQSRAALGRLAQRDGRSLAGYIRQMIRNEAVAKGTWVPRKLTAVRKES